MVLFVAAELRRSYSELPVRWLCDVVLMLRPRAAEASAAVPSQASASVGRRPTSGMLRRRRGIEKPVRKTEARTARSVAASLRTGSHLWVAR